MDVLEYEIGVEIGSRSFFGSAYNGNLAIAQASAQSIIGHLNSRFLHGSGVKFTLGTVIIRTNASTDPLRDLVTGTGTSPTASSSLVAFRNYWNNNPGEVGTTHDVAVYHVKAATSGLAYVNRVATRIILTYIETGPLSVDDNNLKNMFSVYPNPTNSILNIKIKDHKNGVLSIVDILGNSVYSEEKTEIGGVAVDISNWSHGVYFVIFKIDNHKIVKKIIVD